MEWLQRNSFTAMVGSLIVVFILILYITDEKIEAYEQIEVAYGDTLWTLADQYRGKMSKDQWIAQVKEENMLFSSYIIVGQELTVPIEKSSRYIAERNEPVAPAVEVASNKR